MRTEVLKQATTILFTWKILAFTKDFHCCCNMSSLNHNNLQVFINQFKVEIWLLLHVFSIIQAKLQEFSISDPLQCKLDLRQSHTSCSRQIFPKMSLIQHVPIQKNLIGQNYLKDMLLFKTMFGIFCLYRYWKPIRKSVLNHMTY